MVESGLITRQEIYEPDDRATMIARYAELGGGQGPLGGTPPERVWAEYVRRWTERDPDRFVEGLYAQDFVSVDHRKIGWEEMSRDAAKEHCRSLLDSSPDLRLEIDEVVVCDDRVIALDATWRGSSEEGGGVVELALGYVSVSDSGLVSRLERYDHGDHAAMVARYEELGERASP